MKKRKTYIVMAVLIAAVVLGVGYAAITNIGLQINGTASATAHEENFKVKFDDDTEIATDKTNVSANSTSVVVTPGITDDHNATLTVSGLTTTGDTVTATYTVKNISEELSATIAAGAVQNSNTEYFDVTSVVNNPATIAPNGSTTVTVTVELIKTPIADQTATLTIPFTATPVEAA